MDNTENITAVELEPTGETVAEITAEAVANSGETVTMRELLDRIDRIINDRGHLQNIAITDNISIGEAVRAREETNQRLIALLERMYDDLKSAREPKREFSYELAERSMKIFMEHLERMSPSVGPDQDPRPKEARLMFEKLFHLDK
jgi:hypothetical protein